MFVDICISALRYEFLEQLWMHRKGKTPRSSVEFALLEQKLDPAGSMLQSSKALMLDINQAPYAGLPAAWHGANLQTGAAGGKTINLQAYV